MLNVAFEPWIRDVRIAGRQDYDGDGYASQITFEADLDAIGSGPVLFTVYKTGGNSASSAIYTVDGQQADWQPAVLTANWETRHGTYDLGISLTAYPDSPYARIFGWSTDFPALKGVKLEMPSEDHDFLPRITSIRQVASLDQDGDGYAQWRDYEITVSSAIRGTAYVELRRHKFLDFSAPLVSTAPFIIEQNGTITQTLRVYGSDHDAYNLIAQIKDGAGDVRFELDGSDDPLLAGAKMEKAADDPLPPAPYVSLFVIGSPIDVDGDGYARLRKATLQIDIPAWPAATAYAELAAPTPSGQIPVGRTGTLTVIPELHLPVTFDVTAPEVLGGGMFDLVLNLYSSAGTLIKSYDKSSFPMLGGVGLEAASRDVTDFKLTITDVRRANEVDTDGDGYLEYFYFIVSYSSNINQVAYLSASPEGSHPTQVGQLFTAKTGDNAFFLPIQADPDLVHGTYSMTLRIHDEYDKVLDTVLPLEDIDLRDIPMELPSEQTVPVTITDVLRGPSRDEDADGYFEAIELQVTVDRLSMLIWP